MRYICAFAVTAHISRFVFLQMSFVTMLLSLKSERKPKFGCYNNIFFFKYTLMDRLLIPEKCDALPEDLKSTKTVS